MDEEDENTFTRAHRYSLFGSRSISLGALALGVDQLNQAIQLYQLCAQATPTEEQQVRQAIAIIVDGLKEKIRNIQAIHSIGTTQPSTLQAKQQPRSDNTHTHSLPLHPRHSLPPQLSLTTSSSQPASTQSVSIPSSNKANPPSINTSISTTTVVNSHSRLSEENSISAQLVSSDPSHLRQVISSPAHFLQLVHIFLYAPHFLNKKMMNEHGHAHHYQQHDVSDYTRIQNVLHEMKQIADRLRTSTAIAPSSASSSSQLPSKLDAQQANVQVRNLFHQYLRSIEPSRTGMTPQQIELIHQQMNQLQTQYLDLLHSHSPPSSTPTIMSDPSMVSQLATDLSQRVRDVMHTLDHAQKQALTILREKQQHQQQGALTDGINAGAEHIQLLPFDSPSPHQPQPQPLASPSSNLATSPSSVDSQIRALQKALHERERELKLERMARLKAEKSLAKNQERWRQLEEKVAAKKKAAQGSGQGQILTTTVGSTDASSPSPLSSSSSSSSPSSSASGAPFLSGSTASIHVAKPVRVGNSPAK